MKNTITINANKGYAVDCIDSIYDGSNTLYLHFLTTVNLSVAFSGHGSETITPQSDTFEIPLSWFSANDLTFTVGGVTFTIKHPTTTTGNMTITIVNDTTYQINFYGEEPSPIVVDDALSTTSINPVQNKVITAKLNTHDQNITELIAYNGTQDQAISGKAGVIYGEGIPSNDIGSDKDFYLRLKELEQDILTATGWEGRSSSQYPIDLINFNKIERNKFDFDITGIPSNYGEGENIWIDLNGLEVGNTYLIQFDLQFNSGASFQGGYTDSLVVAGNQVAFNADTNKHSYTLSFTYAADTRIKFQFYALQDDVRFTATITDFEIIGDWSNDITELYNKKDGAWKKYNEDKAALDIYSLSEQVVGSWIDGKPLYQITVDCGNAPNSSQKDIPIPAQNYDLIWIHEGFMENLSTLASLPINLSRPDDNSLASGCYTTSSGTIRIMTRTDRSAFKCYVTLRYTKSTD